MFMYGRCIGNIKREKTYMKMYTTIKDICTKCGGYKFAPYNPDMDATVKLCHCTKDIDIKPLIIKPIYNSEL